MAVTFFTTLPFMQTITVFLASIGFVAGTGVAVGVAEGAGVTASCESFTLMLGVENVNPPAVILSQPSFSEMTVVATDGVPSELETSIFA